MNGCDDRGWKVDLGGCRPTWPMARADVSVNDISIASFFGSTHNALGLTVPKFIVDHGIAIDVEIFIKAIYQ